VGEPLPLCYLNGELVPLHAARISPLDRGFLFGDGVYEVIPVYDGRVPRLHAHLARLARSLAELRIRNPHDDDAWRQRLETLITRNGGGDLYVYLQISRGAEFGRNHAPPPDLVPTVFAFCAPLPVIAAEQRARGVACITAADTRWLRCDIKSVSLLANVLLRAEAARRGATEAILLRDGWLTEGSASSVHVIIDGEIRTPPNSAHLLPGTTRGLIDGLADAHGIRRRVMAVSDGELRAAAEIWIAAAARGVAAVTSLDGRPVGNGRPGPLWQQMDALLQAFRRDQRPSLSRNTK
jgi:D-alanine transaminase